MPGCRHASGPSLSWQQALVVDVATGTTRTISDRPILAEWAPDGSGVYYDVRAGEMVDLRRPARQLEPPDLVTNLDWAPEMTVTVTVPSVAGLHTVCYGPPAWVRTSRSRATARSPPSR